MRYSSATHLLHDIVDHCPRHKQVGWVLIQQRHVGRGLAVNAKDRVPGVVERIDYGDHEDLRIRGGQSYNCKD